jgi:hypothetical protein
LQGGFFVYRARDYDDPNGSQEDPLRIAVRKLSSVTPVTVDEGETI